MGITQLGMASMTRRIVRPRARKMPAGRPSRFTVRRPVSALPMVQPTRPWMMTVTRMTKAAETAPMVMRSFLVKSQTWSSTRTA